MISRVHGLEKKMRKKREEEKKRRGEGREEGGGGERAGGREGAEVFPADPFDEFGRVPCLQGFSLGLFDFHCFSLANYVCFHFVF